LSGRGLCDELITRPEESYRLCYVVVCDLETSRMGAPYIYDISHLRVKILRTYRKHKHFLSATLSAVCEGLLWSSVGMYFLPAAQILKTSLQITA